MALVRKLIFELCVFKCYRKKITQVFVESDLYFDYRLITIISLLTDWQKCGEWFWEAKFFQGVKGRGRVSFATREKNATKGWTLVEKNFYLSVCLFVCMSVSRYLWLLQQPSRHTRREGKWELGIFVHQDLDLVVCVGEKRKGEGEKLQKFLDQHLDMWVRIARRSFAKL